MEQMKIPPDKIITIDFESKELSTEVRELRPVVFHENGSFCCLLGPDLKVGILGIGNSPETAIKDWQDKLRDRLRLAKSEDEIAAYVRDSLNASNKKVW